MASTMQEKFSDEKKLATTAPEKKKINKGPAPHSIASPKKRCAAQKNKFFPAEDDDTRGTPPPQHAKLIGITLRSGKKLPQEIKKTSKAGARKKEVKHIETKPHVIDTLKLNRLRFESPPLRPPSRPNNTPLYRASRREFT